MQRLIEDLKLANQRLEAALQQVRTADMAKQKVIDHLSHELKTPLAVISSAFRHLADKLPEKSHSKLTKTIDRGLRNVSRLITVQNKVDDIINSKDNNTDKARYQRIIEGLSDIAEELSEEDAVINRRVLDLISARIESIYQVAQVSLTTIRLNQFIEDIISQALEAASSRDVHIKTDLDAALFIEMDPTVLSKVFIGILKNAIENTPDGGSINISAISNKSEVVVFFRDTGVGIARDDQRNIFGGFFHTQETYNYGTKRPYQFNAGGTGSDLLRIKTFSERFGFRVALSSRRCGFLQPGTEQCPGAIDDCRHIHAKTKCGEAGGTEVTLRFAKLGRLNAQS